jgi:enoyl-CoA hydratase
MKRHLNDIARGELDTVALQGDIVRTLRSDDLREGQAAWAEKREPRFKGS